MQSEADIRANVGHADARMTSHDANFFYAATAKAGWAVGKKDASGTVNGDKCHRHAAVPTFVCHPGLEVRFAPKCSVFRS